MVNYSAYHWSEKAKKYAEEAQKRGKALVFRGSVQTFEDLPTIADIGDMYDVLENGANYAWTGEKWDNLGGVFDTLPNQLGNEGKALFTDGENAYWGDVSGGLEVGDIGIAPLGIDETKNLRRYLNGQVISQTQFAAFTNLIKQRVLVYPSLATTEENWQAEVTNSVFGQCGKFVIDDALGTIRLPKITGFIQGLTDLGKLGEVVNAGLPNITGKSWDSSYYTGFIGKQYGAFNASVENSSPAGATGTADNFYAGVWSNFDASKSNAIYGNSSTVQPEAIKYPYFIQVATGNEEQADITTEIRLNNPFSLLEPKWSDKLLTNASWLRSNGQGNSGTVYIDAYNLILSEYNNGVDTTETVGGVTITYRRGTTTNMKITTDKTAYDNILLATGTAWYFVLDTVNTLFYLPQTNGFFQFGGEGDYVEAGLPNITGDTNLFINETTTSAGTGALKTTPSQWTASESGSANRGWQSITFDASRSSSIYGKSSTVQPNAVKGYLYFYVGETIQDANVIVASSVLTKVANSIDRNDLKQIELPTGSVVAFAANSTPNGYLICNGAAVSRTTYAYLFGVIGTTYGAGDGSTTFNVPNLTDKFIQGSGTAGTSKAAGLPNITGTIGNIRGDSTNYYTATGAFTSSEGGRSYNGYSDTTGRQMTFNASRSSSIYGKSSTVQPPALTMRFYIKY